jgi:Helix-turn-helix domain
MPEPQASVIKQICDMRGVSYRWLAGQLGVLEQRFNHIEAGRLKAPPGYYERASVVLGVPVQLLRPPAPGTDGEPEPEAAAI